jgi:hypothetical protein
MALHQSGIVTVLRDAVEGLYHEVATGSSRAMRYGKFALIALTAFAGMGAGYMGYRWYVSHREEQAQYAFAAFMKTYYQALHGSADERTQALLGMKVVAEQNASSYLSPYFIAAQADLTARDGRKEEAVTLLDKALVKTHAQDPLLPMLRTKQALIMMDCANEAIQKQGLARLAALAKDTNNKQRDVALYYLGEYEWAHDHLDAAQGAWQELMAMQRQEQVAPSAWVQLVEDRLTQIS